MIDVVIVGAGPAGLSAGLLLGRCRRTVIICDTSQHRNAASEGLHGFLSRDGIPPAELLKKSRDQLSKYPSVELREIEVVDARCVAHGFELRLKDGRTLASKKLLLATGVKDILPAVEGIEQFYGRSIFHCPYCDGWEVRDQPLAVYGNGKRAYGLALELMLWSKDVIVCTDGPADLSPEETERLKRNHIRIYQDKVLRFEGSGASLRRIVFENDEPLERSAIFFTLGQQQRSSLLQKLGCQFSEKGSVKTDRHSATGVPGLYVAGDASEDVQFAIVAAAEGAMAAYDINTELLKEELE